MQTLHSECHFYRIARFSLDSKIPHLEDSRLCHLCRPAPAVAAFAGPPFDFVTRQLKGPVKKRGGAGRVNKTKQHEVQKCPTATRSGINVGCTIPL